MIESSALDEITKRGQIRIGSHWADPPTDGPATRMRLHPDTGRLTGVVPDLGRLLAADLQVEPEFVNLEWSDYVSALQERRVDLFMSYTNTPARALQVDFGAPLLPHEVLVLVRQDGPTSEEELREDSQAIIAAVAGSSVADAARLRFPDSSVVEVEDPADILEAGQATATVQDAITNAWLARHAAIRPLRQSDGRILVVSREYGHPAVRRGDLRLLNWINNWIVYHRAQGTIERLCDGPLRATFAT